MTVNRNAWNGMPKKVIALYMKIVITHQCMSFSNTRHEKPRVNYGRLWSKAKYIL